MAELPQIGDSIAARYRVEGELGVGGMGAVFACSDLGTGRRVAIKWLKPELADDAAALARFLAEAKRLGGIEHPNVVGVLDAATDPASGAPFLVMELLRGESLEARLRRGALPEDEAVRIATAVARGVAEAHRGGVVHRDLKPANVLLCEAKDGTPLEPKVVDFGIAKLQEGDARITRTGRVVGTPRYMTPEQLSGSREIDPRLDVYAIGAIVFEMIAGQPAFREASIVDLVRAITQVGAPPLRAVAPGASDELAALVARAMQRDPNLRPADAGVERLERVGEAATLGVAAPAVAERASGHAPTVGVAAQRMARPVAHAPASSARGAVEPRPRPPSTRPPAARPRRSGVSPVVLFGALVLGLGALVAGVFGLIVLSRAVATRSRGAGLASEGSGGAPQVDLRLRSSCGNGRFAPPLTVRHVGNRIDIISHRVAGITDTLSLDPGTRAQTGAFELSSQHAYTTGFALTLVAGGLAHTNFVRRPQERDPVHGTALVRRFDSQRGLLDLELRGVVLYGNQTGGLCLADGHVRTFGLTTQ